MGKLNIENGTPVGNDHLCLRCSWGQCMTGYRESDRLVICTNTNPNLVVPFTMLECTGFSDKHRPCLEQMKRLAINIRPVRVSARTAGFSAAASIHPIRKPDEDKQEGEAASV
ncbi:MAG: hypothetical protein WBE72_11795 [Terracidiphilus sp.]